MTRALHWFRNDLRRRDNTALIEASRRADELVLLYVLDDHLLGAGPTGAPRVRFLLDNLARLSDSLEERGQRLVVHRGDPAQVVPQVLEESKATLLSLNRDSTPYARARDRRVLERVRRAGADILESKDRVVFESGEVQTQQGKPYLVYSPYRRAWQKRFEKVGPKPQPAPRLPGAPVDVKSDPLPSAADLGFGDDDRDLPTGGEDAAQRRLTSFLDGPVAHYTRDRNLPAVDGTSRLSPYLRFGAISIRDCVDKAREAVAAEPRLARGVGTWIDELVWREFYAAILEARPRVAKHPYREELEKLQWNADAKGFRAWCEGCTGYPMVDAGMRQLAAEGWMHNRSRMIVASFLTKDLLIDWRRGERFFFQNLVDGDPASNNGGWQWSASTGSDAAPYFRIFNPVSQGKKYDPDGAYVRRFVPELAELPDDRIHEPWKAASPPKDYPERIVDHAERRDEALDRYRRALGKAG